MTDATSACPLGRSGDYTAILADLAEALGLNLRQRAWSFVPPKAGPNAVHKIMVPAAGGDRGYVITVADQADTPVIRREADVLTRLHADLSPALAASIPELLACRRAAGVEYFALPLYAHSPVAGLRRRLTRRRRVQWTVNWLTELARATRGAALDRDRLREEFGGTAAAVAQDSTIPAVVRTRVAESLAKVCAAALRVPAVCCHGDLWSGNQLWNRACTHAVVLDWGAARWPGLPAVDLCRFLLGECRSDRRLKAALQRYCAALDLELTLVPALYDVYLLFVKSELDHAYADSLQRPRGPFAAESESQVARLRRLMNADVR